MGVDILSWRARIGGFGLRRPRVRNGIVAGNMSLVVVFHFLILLILLLIGNIEINPGPTYSCQHCELKFLTTGEHLRHQRYHEGLFNFRFVCPLSTCSATFGSYASVNSHLSNHSTSRTKTSEDFNVLACDYCDLQVASYAVLCQHLKKQHLKQGEMCVCPIPQCKRNLPFTTPSNFSNHLSSYHPGWRTEEFTSSNTLSTISEDVEANVSGTPFRAEEDGSLPGLTNNLQQVYESCDGDEMDTDSESTSDSHPLSFEHKIIVDYIANFYAFLEGDQLIPSQIVDLIAQKLAFISEKVQSMLKKQLTNELMTLSVPEDDISRIISNVTAMDPLYNTHHKNALKVSLTTSHTRKEYYKKHFKYVEPVEINLKVNPHDREATIQYINIKETLNVMLQDVSVQKEVDSSFVRENPAASVYTSGNVFKDGNNPRKRIDILLFMDAFSCVNPLGSGKIDSKYKMNGVYFTLGNLKPYQRSFLKAKKLVLMFRDNLLKLSERKFKRCFKRIVKDLKDLEVNGIVYKGEDIPVRLQFILGDNLGQHTIGGFLENFTANYFCRYCDITKAAFQEQQNKDPPEFQAGNWRTHDSFQEALSVLAQGNVASYNGIKRDSPFNELEHFKIAHPRLVSCLAHDLFIGGMVDHDLASMLLYFVEKGWFTYHELNMHISRTRYLGNDKRNKPAPVKDFGSKLGGHAIQNWTLLRLLPFLIGERVNPRNRIWKLYLLLKSACEYVCAPSLSDAQIDHMRYLLEKYMKKRKTLPNSYKPKHHYILHYPDLFRKFGALIYHWTLGFEQRHQYFKKAARVCKNFTNLAYTLASKFELHSAYLSMGILFPTDPLVQKSFPLIPDNYEEQDLKNVIVGCNFSPNALDVESMVLNETIYKRGQCLLISQAPEDGDIFVGHIQAIICDGPRCELIMLKYRAKYWKEYGIYKIDIAAPMTCSQSLSDGTLENPCPHPLYEFKGEQCCSLKHVFLNMM